MKIAAKKITAALMVLLISFGFAAKNDSFYFHTYASRKSDLEAKQKELENKLGEVEKALNDTQGDISLTEQYLEYYDEKMILQEEQVNNLNEQITECEAEIERLGALITEKQAEIDEGIAMFWERLRAIYISGNDSVATALVGAGDFYEMLARMELIERMSEYDSRLIDDLNVMIAGLDADIEEQESLKAEVQRKSDEALIVYEDLRLTYAGHSETLAALEAEKADYEQNYDKIQAEQEKTERELQEELVRLQKEAEEKRRREEQARKEEEERKRREALEKGESYAEADVRSFVPWSDTGFIWPVPTVRNMSDRYGPRYIIETGRNDNHKGIDITKPGCKGENIVASAGGTVIQAGNKSNGYGNCVIIDHGNSIATLYGHCDSLAVKAGDNVAQGQVVGYIGNTGQSYGNHLHFEVRVDGQHVDPLKYVNINN